VALRTSTLTLNPSPSGRGTYDHCLGLLPFALREKGLGNEGFAYISYLVASDE
jgi:hypothetical protein